MFQRLMAVAAGFIAARKPRGLCLRREGSGKPELKVSLRNTARNNDRDDDCSMAELSFWFCIVHGLRGYSESLVFLFWGVEDASLQDVGFRSRSRVLLFDGLGIVWNVPMIG